MGSYPSFLLLFKQFFCSVFESGGACLIWMRENNIWTQLTGEELDTVLILKTQENSL